MYENEVSHSSVNKFLMLLSSNLTALKNHLLRAQLNTLYLLTLQRILSIFNLSAITHSNNISWLIFSSYICFFNKEKSSDGHIDNLSFTGWWLWKCVISSLTNIVNRYVSDLRIWALNLKVRGSILQEDSDFLLCPMLVTRWQKSFSISSPSSKFTIFLFNNINWINIEILKLSTA